MAAAQRSNGSAGAAVPMAADPGLSAYIRAARKYPILSPEVEADLARRWRDERDERAKSQILGAHLRYVVKVAMSYRGYNVPIEDLISEGNLAMVRCFDRFEIERGFRFSTFAMWWIRAGLTEYVLRTSTLVKFGASSSDKRLFFKLRRAKASLGFYEAGDLSEGAAAALADHLGASPEDVVRMNQRLYLDGSLNRRIGDGEGLEFGDTLAAGDSLPDELVADQLDRERHRALIEKGLGALSERERDIFVRRNLTDEPVTLEDLSLVYGVSRERIRQIEVAAKQKFADRLKHVLAFGGQIGRAQHRGPLIL
ncbi:RNA polymerase factor sigma-32 [Sphingosinicella sp. BN140058]|uniref:RNA polymerase factor sigma-32 n=1 Tax=Sphingosinicella sp. BN140058 TaxID=1892855 RepID=UPI0013E9FFFE|nr:RNA polymerase factor sigma-32 [Sphingosinicella sp. BN140058]